MYPGEEAAVLNEKAAVYRELQSNVESAAARGYVDHEVRSVAIASRFIELTEEEQLAILWHNGLYGPFKYEIQGNETPLYMLLHFADLWAARVTEDGSNGAE